MAKKDLSKAEWLDKAEAYCARSEHCAADIRRKLCEWSAPTNITDFIEEKLYENDFINDARFCRAYVHDKVEYQAWGRLKILSGLRALQLPEPQIREALANIDEDTYSKNIKTLILQHSSDSEEKRLRFLLQRGFSYEEIRKFS